VASGGGTQRRSDNCSCALAKGEPFRSRVSQSFRAEIWPAQGCSERLRISLPHGDNLAARGRGQMLLCFGQRLPLLLLVNDGVALKVGTNCSPESQNL
jgi:hypothetical protein